MSDALAVSLSMYYAVLFRSACMGSEQNSEGMRRVCTGSGFSVFGHGVPGSVIEQQHARIHPTHQATMLPSFGVRGLGCRGN
jgi:hypothetical protein